MPRYGAGARQLPCSGVNAAGFFNTDCREGFAYGLRAWSVTPAGGGEWDTVCDAMGAPGLQHMCAEVGLCDQPK